MTYAAVNSAVHGPLVARSSNGGHTWSHSGNGLSYGDGGPELTAVWAVKAGARPGEVYAGANPAGLFRSDDGGDTWTEVPALREHPTNEHWYPGAAGLILHTIVPHPTDPGTMWCGISAAGVYKTEDAGASWRPQNVGIPAPWDSPEVPVAGQCCHKIRLAAGSSTRLYQQNHMGQFRSDDGGDTWESIQSAMPSEFGFCVAVHARDEDTAWFIPMVGPEERYVPEGKPIVYRTRDGGSSYEALSNGLPPRDSYLVILRDAMISDGLDPVGVYFGTSTGQIYATADEGDSWRLAADLLPPVHVVHSAAS